MGRSRRTLQEEVRTCEEAPLITKPVQHPYRMWHRGLMGISNGRGTLQAGVGVQCGSCSVYMA